MINTAYPPFTLFLLLLVLLLLLSNLPGGCPSMVTAGDRARNPALLLSQQFNTNGPIGTSPVENNNSLQTSHRSIRSAADVVVEEGSISDENRLISDLMTTYKRHNSGGVISRPVLNASQTIRVDFGFTLLSLIDLDIVNHKITLNLWVSKSWVDELLRWDPSKYGGISYVRLPLSALWTPDIKLYNSATIEAVQSSLGKHLAQVYYDGTLRTVEPEITTSDCVIDVLYFPNDQQVCNLKYGSWTYEESGINLTMSTRWGDSLDLSAYSKNKDWDLIGTTSQRNAVSYDCCPEIYVDITYTLVFRRRSYVYIALLLLPAIILTIITIIIFSASLQEKTDIVTPGLLVIFGFFTLMAILNGLAPSSSHPPILGRFYLVMMFVIPLWLAISVICSKICTIQSEVGSGGGRGCLMPSMIRQLMQLFTRLLCIKTTSSSLSALSFHYRGTENKEGTSVSFSQDGIISNVCAGGSGQGSAVGEAGAKNDWQIFAVILDRLFFLLFTLVIVICALLVICAVGTPY